VLVQRVPKGVRWGTVLVGRVHCDLRDVLGQFRSLSAETYLRHCSLIPKRCNAIQTLLQLNSNNSNHRVFGRGCVSV
jgi:hypothetical protein